MIFILRPKGATASRTKVLINIAAGWNGTKSSNRGYLAMKPTPFISEKKAAIFIGIGAAVFTIGAMIFGH
jgi:hypothetical protein